MLRADAAACHGQHVALEQLRRRLRVDLMANPAPCSAPWRR
jgi:hypothetical protein